MDSSEWYSRLKKPSWAPPDWLFGPAWIFLYILIFISFGKVFIMTVQKELSFTVALPFILNLVFNFSFTPLQFKLRSNILALADILLILATLIWSVAVIWDYRPWIAYINMPYLFWVTFATALQLTITYLNRERQ